MDFQKLYKQQIIQINVRYCQVEYYARKDQELIIHITNVANIAKKFADVFCCANMAYTAGLLHDMGKYSYAFQDYLRRSLNGDNVIRGDVIHALQGAKYITESINDAVIASILGNIIATHHGGLFDSITDGEETLKVRTIKREEELHYEEVKQAYCPTINSAELQKEIVHICLKCKEKKLNTYFMLHLMAKVLYSCLVDADRCDAAGLTQEDSIPDWSKLCVLLENHLSRFSNNNVLGNLREHISEQCLQAGKRQPGIYTLSVPTGGGKTLSSLRFALEHARKQGMKRIIYVIPYLSILDQTASTLHEIFKDDELILEHHSNVEIPDDNEQDEQYNLLSSRWDAPIVMTTMVQFLETIYSNKASKLRKFHSMSESVLIFDEIQALPIKCVHLFNESINFLQNFCRSTILLCTATQPHLQNTERKVLLCNNPNIVNITPDALKNFERVLIKDETQYAMDHVQIAALVKKQIDQEKSTLVILNTKGDARKIFKQCKQFDCEKFYLTTDLCPAHRLDILDKLGKNLALETRKLTLCVSTQLIEAGVDVSFDCVIRAEAGLDSIIQAAGRCNRNKENPVPQTVFVVDVKDENLSRLPEIDSGKKQTARVFRENKGKNLLGSEVIDMYYQYYFFDQKDKMDYIIDNGNTTIYSLLSNNPLATAAFESLNNVNYLGLPCAFKSAADAFSVIDGGQTGIVVPYGDALTLVENYQKSYDIKEKIRILKKLQKYTVSVYAHTLSKIEHVISPIDNAFYLLSQDYYDCEEMGLLFEQKLPFLNV